jgi:hypothetical protein
MARDVFHYTTTCAVCGYARGIRGVRVVCCCRRWVVFWRQRLFGERS